MCDQTWEDLKNGESDFQKGFPFVFLRRGRPVVVEKLDTNPSHDFGVVEDAAEKKVDDVGAALAPGEVQVWSLTRLYYVDFSQTGIGVKKRVLNKRTIKVWVSCC